MNLEIYDGEHGTKLFPYNPTENEKIKRFFNDNIDLYIEKEDDNIVIYCKVDFTERSDRPEIFYLVYSDKITEDYFLHFKDEVNKAILKLDLKPVSDKETDNIIYRNINLFSDQSVSSKQSFRDIDDIIYLINRRRHLEFKSGNINDIIVFCREILKNPNNESISISTGDTLVDAGNINILLGKNFEMFSPTDNTKDILDDYKKEADKNRKEEVKLKAKQKIKQGFDIVFQGFIPIVQGILDMKKAGITHADIEEDPDFKEFKNKVLDKLSLMGKDKKSGITPTIMASMVLVLISGILMGMTMQPYLFKNNPSPEKGIVLQQNTTNIKPTPTKIPTPNPTDTPIVVITVSPTAQIITNSAAEINSSEINTTNISNISTISNTTKSNISVNTTNKSNITMNNTS